MLAAAKILHMLRHVSCQIALQDKMQKSMSKDMVEPKRKYIDMESTWKKKLLNKAAGPGGLLIVTMVQARDLRYHPALDYGVIVPGPKSA